MQTTPLALNRLARFGQTKTENCMRLRYPPENFGQNVIYSNVTFRNLLEDFGEKSSRPPYPFRGFNLSLRVKLDKKS